MASVTLAESAKLSQNMLARGIIENVIVVDRFFQVLPFLPIEGNSLAYNRENVLGASEWTGVGSTISAGKAAATFTQVTTSLTTLVADAEVNGLIQATRSGFNDQKAIQIASKAKSLGLAYRDKLINGAGASNEINGLLALGAATAGQIVQADTAGVTTNGGPLTFELLDALIDKVTDKNGIVDYIQMNPRSVRKLMSLYRALGGAGIGEVVNLPGMSNPILAYRGIPVFSNANIPVNQTVGSATACTTVVAGTLDDGSMKMGISGLTAASEAGIRVDEVGLLHDRDESLTRLKWYCGLALFNTNGLALLTGVTT
jgi:hypothetical protein